MARLNIELADDVKARSKKLFATMGMSLSTAIKVFLKQSISDGGLPFKPTIKTNGEPARLYVVKTENGSQNLDKYVSENPEVPFDILAKMVLNVPGNIQLLKKWAIGDIRMAEIRFVFGKKFLDGISKSRLVDILHNIPNLNQNVINKNTLDEFRKFEIHEFLADGHDNQTSELSRSQGIAKTAELKCTLIDYIGAKELHADTPLLQSTFRFLTD